MLTKGIRVDEDVWDALRRKAFEAKTTIGDVVRGLVLGTGGSVAPEPAAVGRKKAGGSVVEKNEKGAAVVGAMAETLANFGPGSVTPNQRAVLTDIQDGETPVCPKCGCVVGIHQAGTNHDRCENHMSCRWTPEGVSHDAAD